MATYFIKYPNPKEKRRSFSVHRREKGKSPTVSDPRLSVVNERYAAGLDFETAARLVREVVAALRAAEAPTPTAAVQDNLRVARQYLDSRSTGQIVDKYAAEREVFRAAEAFGSLMLEHATQKQLQDHLDSHYAGAKHARLAKAANRLLKFLRKDFELEPGFVMLEEPVHVLLPDFLKKLTAVEPREHRLLFGALYGTGGREGEVFALKTCYVDKVHISRQMDRKLRVRQTKNAKATPAHDAVIIPELKSYVAEWCAVPDSVRRELRRLNWWKICHRWFGVGPHALRHSYAKRLCEMGAYLPEIAANLGTSERVAKQHYAGWLQSDSQISALARRLRGEG